MSLLEELGACKQAQEWADSQVSYRKAWQTCERADWMLWIAKKQNVDIRKLTAAKVSCARTVEHLMKDERSIKALKVAQDFADGKATLQDLNNAVYAAADAAVYAAADAAVYAAADAAAAAAVYAAADTAVYAAADAAAADAYADAAYRAYNVARKEALKKCADLVREHISFDDLKIGV